MGGHFDGSQASHRSSVCLSTAAEPVWPALRFDRHRDPFAVFGKLQRVPIGEANATV
jgi:hypothetical protein